MFDSIRKTEFFKFGILKFPSMIAADPHNLLVLLNLNLLE
jgi:hypothetical protein